MIKGLQPWHNISGLRPNPATQFKKGATGFTGKHTDETKDKLSKNMKLQNRGEAYYQKVGLKGLISQQNSKEPTSIEKKVYDYLLLKGILFERQKLVNGRFIVDAYIPSLNLVIEADGKYWHDLDRVVKKDKAENAYLTKCGFKLIRLTEKEINSGDFKERLVL
jgi:very-short-patch-repair endonuclease